MPGDGEQVGQLPDAGEAHAADQFHRGATLVPAKVQLDRLREPGEVVDAQHQVVAELSDESQHAGVGRAELGVAALAEGGVPLADLNHCLLYTSDAADEE